SIAYSGRLIEFLLPLPLPPYCTPPPHCISPSRHPACFSRPAHTKWIALRVGQEENQRGQDETDEQANRQQHQAADAQVNDACDDRQADTRYRHDDPAEQVREKFLEAVDIRGMNSNADLLPAGATEERLPAHQQRLQRYALLDDAVL